MMDQPQDNNHNLDISDNEQDLGVIEPRSREITPKIQPKIKLDLKPKNDSAINKNITPVKKSTKKEEAPDLLGLDNDDFNDFVSHRISPEKTNNKPVDLFSNNLGIGVISPAPAQSNVDLFDIGITEPASSNTDLFSLDTTQTTTILPKVNQPNVQTNKNSTSDFDFFDFGEVATSKPIISSSATMPNLNLMAPNKVQNLAPVGEVDLFSFGEPETMNNTGSVQTLNKMENTKNDLPKPLSLWDDLSKTVDINLDNLSPYSKGVKSKQANVPMNHLPSSTSQSVFASQMKR